MGSFLAGLLGTTELAAQSVLSHFGIFFYSVPAGLGAACRTIIGQHVGQKSENKSIFAYRLTIILHAFSASSLPLFTYFLDINWLLCSAVRPTWSNSLFRSQLLWLVLIFFHFSTSEPQPSCGLLESLLFLLSFLSLFSTDSLSPLPSSSCSSLSIDWLAFISFWLLEVLLSCSSIQYMFLVSIGRK